MMIYWNGEKWEKNKLKVTYTVEQYTDSKDGFPDGAVFEDVIFTSEQESRLDEIQGIAMNVQEAVLYVRDGIGSIPDMRSDTEKLLDILTDEQILEQKETVSSLVDDWKAGIHYIVGKLLTYNGSVYRVLQSHISQFDWPPDVAVSLFTQVGVTNSDTGLEEKKI